MLRLNANANFRPTADAKGYLDTLKQNKSFDRSIDAYAFAAAYAMASDLDPDVASLKARSDLNDVGSLGDDVRMALECAVLSIRRQKALPEIIDQAVLLEAVTRYAEVGLAALRQRWEGKTRLQIHHDMKLLLEDKG